MNQARKRASPHGAAGDRDRYTYYDSDVSGQTRGLVVAIEQTVRPTQLFTVHGKLSRA